jgi:hypothetical protein
MRIGRVCAPDLDSFKSVGNRDSSACCYSAGDEGSVVACQFWFCCGLVEHKITYPSVVDMTTLFAKAVHRGQLQRRAESDVFHCTWHRASIDLIIESQQQNEKKERWLR